MANQLSNMRYLILGLLKRQPMSGYDIKQYLKRLDWLIGSPSFGSLYPTLHALHEKGWVQVEVIQGSDNKPPRKVYSLKDAGIEALKTWVKQPLGEHPSMRAFAMHLIAVGDTSPTALRTTVEQRRDQVSDIQSTLATLFQDNNKTAFEEQLPLNYGLAMAKAELHWLESILKHL